MYKMIATDLDETLLNSNKRVSKQDIDTIANLNNCHFVIATGRGFESTQEILKQIGQYNKKNTYLISFNGGIITENKDNKILYSNLLPFEDVEYLFNLGLKYNVCIHVYALNCCYAYRIFENETKTLNNGQFHFKTFDTTDLSFLKDKKIAKVLYCIEDMDYLRKIKDEIKLDDKYSISFSSNRYLEINPKGINKGTALVKLCEILNIDLKDTIGVGDNLNDLQLITTSGLGIGVNNSIEDIKQYCDVILDSTNNENPMSEIVNRFMNIKEN